MKSSSYPATTMLSMLALVSFMVGLVGGPCGNTLLTQVFSVTAVPIAFVCFGLVADRKIVGKMEQTTANVQGVATDSEKLSGKRLISE